MTNWEEGTTKNAKGAKREVKILFKDESYKIIGACFEVYKESGSFINRFRVFRAFRS